MKRFDFSLERIRQWREKQVSIEEARLEQRFAEKTAVEARSAALERQASESAALVTASKAIEYFELQAIEAFRRHVLAERAVLATQLAECDRRIVEQQSALMEARRKAELLNKLKDRKWKVWNAELAKEIETQAGEIFLAKWSSERR